MFPRDVLHWLSALSRHADVPPTPMTSPHAQAAYSESIGADAIGAMGPYMELCVQNGHPSLHRAKTSALIATGAPLSCSVHIPS